MTDVYGDLEVKGEHKDFKPERLAEDPALLSLSHPRIWFNTTTNKLMYFDGTSIANVVITPGNGLEVVDGKVQCKVSADNALLSVGADGLEANTRMIITRAMDGVVAVLDEGYATVKPSLHKSVGTEVADPGPSAMIGVALDETGGLIHGSDGIKLDLLQGMHLPLISGMLSVNTYGVGSYYIADDIGSDWTYGDILRCTATYPDPDTFEVAVRATTIKQGACAVVMDSTGRSSWQYCNAGGWSEVGTDGSPWKLADNSALKLSAENELSIDTEIIATKAITNALASTLTSLMFSKEFDGTIHTTPIPVAHGLNTDFPLVQVWNVLTRTKVEAVVVSVDANTITVAPLVSTPTMRVIVTYAPGSKIYAPDAP